VMSYAGLLSKRNKEREHSAYCDYSVLLFGNGAGMRMYGYDGREHATFDARTPILDPERWNYVALVVGAKPARVAVYVNGQKICEEPQKYRAFATGVPLHFGADPSGVTNYDAPERVRFVRLSNAARSEDEIRAVHALLDQGDGSTDPAWECAVQLRDGTVLRAAARTAQQLRFGTSFGELAVPEGAAARLTLAPIRPGDLERRIEDLRKLIAQLGAAESSEREAAEKALLRAGGIALPVVIEAQGNSDAEVAARATRVVDALKRRNAKPVPGADTLQAGPTTVSGWVKAEKLEVETQHGTFSVPVADVRCITVKGAVRAEPVVLRLRSGDLVWGDFPADAGLAVETEFGRIEVPFAQIRGATFREANRCSLRTDKVSTDGLVQVKELKFVTRGGTLTVPIESLREISRPAK